MRLIDADAFFSEFGELDIEPYNNASTVDAVPVIRCKDCKYNYVNIEKDPYDETDYTDIVCTYFMTDGMEADDFCSRGEK